MKCECNVPCTYFKRDFLCNENMRHDSNRIAWRVTALFLFYKVFQTYFTFVNFVTWRFSFFCFQLSWIVKFMCRLISLNQNRICLDLAYFKSRFPVGHIGMLIYSTIRRHRSFYWTYMNNMIKFPSKVYFSKWLLNRRKEVK